VQYYLNLKNEDENRRVRERQEQALVAGIALGVTGLTSRDPLTEIVKQESQEFFNERVTRRIKDIIIINDEWQVYDALNPDYFPTDGADGETVYRNLRDLTDLPPLLDAERLGEDAKNFPNAGKTEDDVVDAEAHAIPIQTNQGRFYVMVILRTDKSKAAWRAAQPLIYTLSLFLVSTAITIFLVWRFTRPIANLSNAARKVAAGNLDVRVPDDARADEMGQLAARFNEMTAELEKKRELETKLQEAEKSAVVGRLGSAIAHEIRNPLNYINLTLDHLRAKFSPEDDAKRGDFEKLTAQLKTEVARINRQIRDFLSYSRPPKLNLEPTDVRKVVEDSLRIVEAEAAEQNVQITLNAAADVPRVFGDAEYLRSVFNNLFINAVQAMCGGGRLDVSIESFENYVKIEVADTGVGISEENLTKIFEPYFSTKETGTGLGLAIVKRIVDEHKGIIGVESELNEGTKFTVRLPMRDEGRGTRDEGAREI
jgi:signal transduction histidine kinase